MAYFGQPVNIQPKAARLTHGTDISNMDPYCVAWLENQSMRTATNFEGGRNPHWNDVLTLYRNNEEYIRFLVYDQDTMTSDDFIGEGYFYFNSYTGRFFEEWIPLQYRGMSVGELHVNVQIPGFKQPAMMPQNTQLYSQAYPPEVPLQECQRPVIIDRVWEGGHYHDYHRYRHGDREFVEEVISTQPQMYPDQGYQSYPGQTYPDTQSYPEAQMYPPQDQYPSGQFVQYTPGQFPGQYPPDQYPPGQYPPRY